MTQYSAVSTGVSRRATVTLVAVAFCVATTVGLSANTRERVPVADEFFYIEHALAIYEHGTLGRLAPDQSIQPAIAGPLYPALLAASMVLDDALAMRAACWNTHRYGLSQCGEGFGLAGHLSALAMGLGVGLVFLTAALLLESPFAGAAAAGCMLLSGIPSRFAEALLTETLTVPLIMASSILLVYGLMRPGATWRLVTAGALLGIATLARPSYLYGGAVLCGLLFASSWAFGRTGREPGFTYRHVLVFLCAFALSAAPWKLHETFSAPPGVRGEVYATYTLAFRTAYNQMSPAQYAAAWIYWLPDFGDSLARRLFGSEVAESLSFGAPDGFYTAGARRILAEIERETGVSINLWNRESGETMKESPLRYILEHKVLREAHRHLAVTLVLGWRGMFPGKLIGLVGFIALLFACLQARDKRTGSLLMLLTLPAMTFNLLHAAISINITRYNIPLLLPYAVAIAFWLQVIVLRLVHERT